MATVTVTLHANFPGHKQSPLVVLPVIRNRTLALDLHTGW